MTSLLDDPARSAQPPDPDPPRADREPPQPPPSGGHGGGRGRGGGSAGRPALALLLVLAAVLGGGASTGILALAGAFDDGGAPAATVAAGSARSGATTPVAATTAAASGGGTLNAAALYARTSPGVVDITSKGVSTSSSGGGLSPFGGPQQPQATTATGTGFAVDRQGHIVTAAHVVDGASSITVKFQDGTTRTARLLGKDDATDVAVLGIDPSGLTLAPLPLGSSKDTGVGDAVAAVGDPFGYERSMSTGIVSGLDRTIQAPNGFTVAHAIQTDAALNPGNSGGPVLNARGEVIGVADQIATGGSSEANTGVGFATPIDLVKSELGDLIAGRDVKHAYLGVSTGTGEDGATVGGLTRNGPAAAAGLRTGDVITAFDGAAIKDSNDLVAAIASHKPGDKVTLTVRRAGGGTSQVQVTLGDQPARASAG